LGVSFVNSSTGQVQQQQFYPASQAIKSGTKIFAFVADDPDTLFQVAVVSGTTVISGVGITAIGNMERWCKTQVAQRQVTLP
jgi:hypothetical protein